MTKVNIPKKEVTLPTTALETAITNCTGTIYSMLETQFLAGDNCKYRILASVVLLIEAGQSHKNIKERMIAIGRKGAIRADWYKAAQTWKNARHQYPVEAVTPTQKIDELVKLWTTNATERAKGEGRKMSVSIIIDMIMDKPTVFKEALDASVTIQSEGQKIFDHVPANRRNKEFNENIQIVDSFKADVLEVEKNNNGDRLDFLNRRVKIALSDLKDASSGYDKALIPAVEQEHILDMLTAIKGIMAREVLDKLSQAIQEQVKVLISIEQEAAQAKENREGAQALLDNAYDKEMVIVDAVNEAEAAA